MTKQEIITALKEIEEEQFEEAEYCIYKSLNARTKRMRKIWNQLAGNSYIISHKIRTLIECATDLNSRIELGLDNPFCRDLVLYKEPASIIPNLMA